MSHNEVLRIANEEVDYAISTIPDIAKLFRNPAVIREHIGIHSESDFYLGGAWATRESFQVLFYPVTNASFDTASYEALQEGYF